MPKTHSQMFDPLAWLNAEWEAMASRGLRRQLGCRQSPQGASILLDGHELINFGSNDYLGLAGEPLVSAVQAALHETGWGSGASPLVSGRAAWHVRLEQRLQAFEAAEAALLFPTGYAANTGTIRALVGKQDIVFSDARNHASIIDGCRLSGASIAIYRHAEPPHLEELLRQSSPFRRRLIVTDGLFSMDGDLAPLPELVELADRYQAMLLVDEAHATGVFGPCGRGICEHFGLEARVPVRVGTFSKALGSMGGFVVGSQQLIDWLSNQARPYVFSTAAPEALAVAAHRALDLVTSEPARRTSLLDAAAEVRHGLRQAGWNIGRSASQIIPIILGDPQRTMHTSQQLREAGFFVPGIRPPSVPEGESLLRISLSYTHTAAMRRGLVEALSRIRTGRSGHSDGRHRPADSLPRGVETQSRTGL